MQVCRDEIFGLGGHMVWICNFSDLAAHSAAAETFSPASDVETSQVALKVI